MSSPVSAVTANLVTEDIEYRALATAPVSPSFWKRFVNDVIFVVSENEIVVLLQHLNSIEPSIQLIVERETDGKLLFLDTCVERTTAGTAEQFLDWGGGRMLSFLPGGKRAGAVSSLG